MGALLTKVWTVSELTAQIRGTLEAQFPGVWVEGEISNLRRPSSGHQYLTLKDAKSQIRAVLFRGAAQRLRFALQDGLEVLAYGRVTVYDPRGEYQLVVESIEPKGIGALQLAYEQLRSRLSIEGLFDVARKRPLPFFPKKIGIVTSLQGAAIRDLLTVLQRRCPVVSILIHPVPVQGEGAASRIAEAIRDLGKRGNLDLMIVGRGGGSLEDLWCFNEEPVVRAIAESPVPVISAVGHEIDVTLADLAADYRAPTPSAAAEIAVPRLEELRLRVDQLNTRLRRALRVILDQRRHWVERTRQAFPDPVRWLYRYGQRRDELETRLVLAWKELHGRLRRVIMTLEARVQTSNPGHRVRQHQRIVPHLYDRIVRGVLASLRQKRHQSEVVMTSLQNLSPLAILGRGYSILQTVNGGTIVRKSQEVSVGESLRATLAQGQLICVVRERHPGG